MLVDGVGEGELDCAALALHGMRGKMEFKFLVFLVFSIKSSLFRFIFKIWL